MLAPGARLGSYEVLAPLGAGGMGEVYRARDTQLDRHVALKILPELFGADEERVMRFTREAKTLAALNHPSIAAIYGIEAGALVMELVEGDDLSTLIARGPMPLADALPIARQIAEALEAAHDAGIIHRDLKPANIKVRADGTAKVLDFGLAKAADPAAAGRAFGSRGAELANSPTFASPATQMGVILGTAAYMSPEQAKGRPIDRRADIWAFGVVLYEMLTGRQLFAAETVAETIGLVVTRAPDLSVLPAGTPEAIRRLIERCLERDPKQRLRDIGEARILLSSPPASIEAPPAPRRWRAAAAVALAGAIAGTGLAWLWLRAPATPAESAPRFSLRRITELPGAELQPDVSPDGRQVVFASAAAGNWDIYVLRVGGGRALNLTAGEAADDQQPVFSPDGERIAFRSERGGGGIFVMGATGESVRRVTAAGYDPAWSPDGRTLAYSTEPVADPYARNVQSELWAVDVATGQTRRLLEGDAVQAAWSPDGKRIAYWANTEGQRDIWTVAAEGGSPVAVTMDAATDWSPEWAPDGGWLYFSSDRGGTMNVWRIAVDPQTGRATGEPQPITSSTMDLGYVRASADGARLVVAGYARSFEVSTAPLAISSAGARVGPASTVRSTSLGWCSISPDGAWLACTSRGAREDIVLMRPDGSETVRLMDDPAKDRNPTWSPDGGTVAFMSTRSGGWELWSIGRDGSDLRQMTDLRANVYEAVWERGGRRALSSASVAPPFGIWMFDTLTTSTRETAKFFRTPEGQVFTAEAWSPDGALVAGSILTSSGVPEKPALWEFPDGGFRTIDLPPSVSARDYSIAGWLPDSTAFVTATGAGLAVVDARTGAARPIAGAPAAARYRLSADARTLFFERVVLDADVWLMEMAR